VLVIVTDDQRLDGIQALATRGVQTPQNSPFMSRDDMNALIKSQSPAKVADAVQALARAA